MELLHPRRRLLYRRLWRARVKVKVKAGVKDGGGEAELKSFVRQLTRTLSTSQLDTLARLVERGDDQTCVPLTAKETAACGAQLTDVIERCCSVWRPRWTAAYDDDKDHQRRRDGGDERHRVTELVDVDRRYTATSGPWCRVIYHQYREHVGSPGSSLPVHSNHVNVFSELHQAPDGLCLSAVRAAGQPPTGGVVVAASLPPWRGQAAEETLARVGRGVTLCLERSSKSVWLYNRSDVAVFALSPTTRVVLKLLPGQSAAVYHWSDDDGDDRKPEMDKSFRSSGHLDCILVSFVKGWSGRYKRQSILSCPCWLEVILARTPDGFWNDDASEF